MIGAVDAQPADGVPDVDARGQRPDVGTRAGQHEPVDGLVRGEPAGWWSRVRRVDQAVPPRMQATRSSASGWTQDTCGGTLAPRSLTRWNTQPATSPTAAHDGEPAGAHRPQPPLGLGWLAPVVRRLRVRAHPTLTPSREGAHCTWSTKSSRRMSPVRSLFSSSSATSPASGISASGSMSYHGWRTNARSCGARVGQLHDLVVATPVADHDDVDVEGARRVGTPPRCGRGRRRPRWRGRGRADGSRPAWCRAGRRR